jgi:hypothetical protein
MLNDCLYSYQTLNAQSTRQDHDQSPRRTRRLVERTTPITQKARPSLPALGV